MKRFKIKPKQNGYIIIDNLKKFVPLVNERLTRRVFHSVEAAQGFIAGRTL